MAPTIVGTPTTDLLAAGGWAPAHPAGIAANDILLWLGESVGGENFATPSGWAHVGPDGSLSSPVVQGVNTQLTVFWRRYDGTGSAPSVTGPADHGCSAMIAVRGCPTTGNPWNVGSVTTEAVSDTSAAWPTLTTTATDTLVFLILATSADIGTAQISAITGTHSLTSVTERVDIATATGGGGVLICYTGIMAAAANIGNPTATLATAGFKSFITMAMANAPVTGVDMVTLKRRRKFYSGLYMRG